MYLINNKKIEILDSKEYGLSSRSVVGKYNNEQIFLIKDRKSRIIMKNGRQILNQIETIKINSQITNIALATNAPICGKTTKLFAENKVEVHHLEK
jgi:hypothetical protein